MSTKNTPSSTSGSVPPSNLFVGRQQMAEEVLELLASDPRSVFIVGPDRIGKTSFLRHLADPGVRTRYGIAQDHVFVYVGCRSLQDGNPDSWCRELEKATLQQLEQAAPQSAAPVQAKFREFVQSNTFSPAQRLDWLFLAVQEEAVRLVLALDDFEALVYSPQMTESFLSVLRALCTKHPVVYLVTSGLPLQDHEYVTEKSPFFSIFHPPMGTPGDDFFGPLSQDESQELVLALLDQAGIKKPPVSVVSCIMELGNGRPYDLTRATQIAIQMWPHSQNLGDQQLCGQIEERFD